MEGKNESFPDKQKLKEFTNTKPVKNVKRTSLKYKEMTLINIKKTCKSKNLIANGKCIVKVSETITQKGNMKVKRQN